MPIATGVCALRPVHGLRWLGVALERGGKWRGPRLIGRGRHTSAMTLTSRFPFTISGKQKLALGLDIGSHAVKLCELGATDKGFVLQTLGSALLPSAAVEDGVLLEAEAVAEVVAGLVRHLKIKNRKVAISISGYSVIVKKINLAVMTEAELEAHIHAEAEQYIPFDIDEVYLDYQDLKSNAGSEGRTNVMLVAAKKEVVDGYLNMLQVAGLKPVVVDVDAFALENAYEANFGLDQNVALVDIGAAKTNINIISKGASILARDVVMGSHALTEQIQNRFSLSYEEAENLKLGQIPVGSRQAGLEEIVVNTCSQWVGEVKRALDFYYSNYPEEAISSLVLSGGGAKLKGLDQYFSEETGLPASIFDPFAKMHFDRNRIDPGYLRTVAPEMALATGLATRLAAW